MISLQIQALKQFEYTVPYLSIFVYGNLHD